jgi:hypothetical protein
METIQGVRKGLPSQRDLKRNNFRAALASYTDNPTVLYDPDNSDKNKLYPMDFVMCVSPQDVI